MGPRPSTSSGRPERSRGTRAKPWGAAGAKPPGSSSWLDFRGVHVAMSRDYSSFGLQDKIAIVTGASQGIGRAIALGLAQAGAHVVLAKHPDGRHEEIKAVQAEIERLGRKIGRA